ncbi:MAG TPA: family 20 glycosylhydrolase [Chthoniobacteraceae bacterium]|nr:family 20 glycosylhydrolase [Chthoniobacteraceae bacterium]
MKSNRPTLSWNRRQVPQPLHAALEALHGDYPLVETDGPGSLELASHPAPSALHVYPRQGGGFRVEYGERASALRGVGHALAGQEARENACFESFGVMLDCSRNAVMTVPYLKRWLRQLALLGYNRLMLYTEDTYRLPGEPYFGYMRGGYSAGEIREIDAYAALFGIEVIACIQTLGHLHQILKWPRFQEVGDTPGVLLVDEEKTYGLIEKMIRFWQENLRSRRIHIGMDEAHDMGRGRFLDRNGWQPPFEIFTRHLRRVSALCGEHGLRPMIWSDMFFRMGNPGMDYYDPATRIPDFVREQIPPTVDLVYWDYTSTEAAFYEEWLRRHRTLGGEPVMASGLWTWNRFWYDHATTRAAVEPCLRACRSQGLREFIFTLWGDGGSYCEFDSAFAGLAWGADLAHGGTGERDAVAPMVRGVCGSDYDGLLQGTRLRVEPGEGLATVEPSTILWDDPLLAIGAQSHPAKVWPRVREEIARLKEELRETPGHPGSVDWAYLRDLLEVLHSKLQFQHAFPEAYETGDRNALQRLAEEVLPRIQRQLVTLEQSYRRQWLRRNKALGMEVIQLRFGAMQVRCAEASRRIGEYLAGTIPRIEELDAREHQPDGHPIKYFYWLATGSCVL